MLLKGVVELGRGSAVNPEDARAPAGRRGRRVARGQRGRRRPVEVGRYLEPVAAGVGDLLRHGQPSLEASGGHGVRQLSRLPVGQRNREQVLGLGQALGEVGDRVAARGPRRRRHHALFRRNQDPRRSAVRRRQTQVVTAVVVLRVGDPASVRGPRGTALVGLCRGDLPGFASAAASRFRSLLQRGNPIVDPAAAVGAEENVSAVGGRLGMAERAAGSVVEEVRVDENRPRVVTVRVHFKDLVVLPGVV